MILSRPLPARGPRLALPAGATDCQTHMFLPGHAPAPGRMTPPAGAVSPADYRALMARLGIERVVVTQSNAHGFDNANLLACLREMGACARGVAAIAPDISDSDLHRLHAAGIRGARIMELNGGATGLAQLAEIDARCAAMDWTLAVQFDGSTILERMTLLHRLQSRWILDHHGKFLGGIAPDALEVTAVLSLIDRGNCWFKFSACYESSLTGGPDYADVGAVAREIAAYAPERLVWGTNWPHNMVSDPADWPDDAHLLDLAQDWAGSEKARRRMLVDNPAFLFGF